MAAWPAAASADPPVYRCGHDFSERPDPACPQAVPLDVADPRSAGDRAAAQQVDRRQKALAARLEADRHAREAAVPAVRPVAPAASWPTAAPAPWRHRSRRAAEAASAASRPFRASVPKAPRG